MPPILNALHSAVAGPMGGMICIYSGPKAGPIFDGRNKCRSRARPISAMLGVVENPSAPLGKAQKYACIERERRWLLREPPRPGTAVTEVEISDAYFEGTRLRLRRVVDVLGSSSPVYKLTQKVPGSGAEGLVTNTYLDLTEYELLSQLGGHPLRKRRYTVPPFGVDVFLPPFEGLVLAEAEFDSDEAMAHCPPPDGAIAEVTDDIRFTGGRLAMTDRTELSDHLTEFGLLRG